MTLLGIVFTCGLVVAGVTSAVVYLDVLRRGLSSSDGLVRGISVGTVSFAGLALSYVFHDGIRYAYFVLFKSRPIASTPYESVLVVLATGIVLSQLPTLWYLRSVR